MQYITEFRNKSFVRGLIKEIKTVSSKEISLMEICGGHTMAIQKFGIPALLPSQINLISGPGCPVCVSDIRFIDKAIAYSRRKDIIITTFGDLIRVPGSTSTLEKEKASGNDIRIVYSVLNALEIARQNPSKKVIFLGIGFETTTPGIAAGILTANEENLSNFFLLSAHKIMPPAMEALIDEGVKINGYICPGHVSTITGSNIYIPIVEQFKIGCVISGFEPTDMLQAILKLVVQNEEDKPLVENAYKRAVKPEGNIKAKHVMNTVFNTSDDWWRGLGIIKKSGLSIKDEYIKYDANVQIDVEVEETKEEKGCICGEILKGLKKPTDCQLFAKKCDPLNPVGACMVSNEGSCHAYYKYAKTSN